MIEQRVTLRYGAQQIPTIVQAVQGDTGRDVIFELADYEIPAGATANYYIDKPDGNAVYNSAEVISSTEVLAHLTEQALAVPGRNNGQVRILSDGEVITSFDFVLEVEAFRGILRLQSETEVNIFDQAIEDAVNTATEEAVAEIQAQTPVVTGMQNSIAPSYSTSSTYAVGDYVMYNAQLYKCNTAISTAEAWTAAHWTQVPLANDVNGLKSALNGVELETYEDDAELSALDSLTYNSWKLNDDGYRVSDASSKILQFRVYAGTLLKVVSDHKFQFQSSSNITASAPSYRIGKTYGSGTYFLKVPEGAIYIAVSTPSDSSAHVYTAQVILDTFMAEQASENKLLESVLDNSIASYIDKINDVEITHFDSLTGIALNADQSGIISAGGQGIVIPIVENTDVHIKKIQTQVCGVCFTTAYPAVGVAVNHYNGYGGVVNTDLLVTSETGDKYILIYVGSASASDILETLEVYLTTDNTENRLGDSVGLDVRKTFANIYNAYTKQVSDIKFSEEPEAVTSTSVDTENMILVNGGGKGVVIPVIAGTSIRVIKEQTPICLACFLPEYPKTGVTINHYSGFTGIVNTNIVVESQAGDRYLYIYTGTAQVDITAVQVYFSQDAVENVEYVPHLDAHMVNLLKYRPVGKISKPYIALSCDDGLEPLATYTLPRIQYWNDQYNTNIPLHMALFDNSPVFANTEYTALIKDMCDNHNCSIGIHGTQPYEYYTITHLYAYIKKQWSTIIDKTGVTPTSVIYPHSSYNDKIMVMSGGFCGICGASGTDPSPYTYKDNNGLSFYIGEKSNCYEIYRLSIRDGRIVGDAGIEAVIDYAYDNNLIICPYFHDEDFTAYDEYTNNYNRARLDKFITYGMSKGIEFINFGDIPRLL